MKQRNRHTGLRLLAMAFALFSVQMGSAAAANQPIQEQEEYVTVELLQEGSLHGEYTKPAELELKPFSDGDTTEEALSLRLAEGMKNEAKEIDVADLQIAYTEEGKKTLKSAFGKAVNDHPELFYVQGWYSYNSNGEIITRVKPVYDSYTDAEKQAFHQEVERALALVQDNTLTDVEKLLILHDYLVTHCAYNWDVATGNSFAKPKWAGNAYGAFVKKDAVCQGYSLAYKLLLDRCGISSSYVESDALNHIWNVVQLNGKWYHIDVTWDDPVPNLDGYCTHDYFLLSNDSIKEAKHKAPDWSFEPSDANDTSYESGWAFNKTDSVLYPYDEYYYYILPPESSLNYSLYRIPRGQLHNANNSKAAMNFGTIPTFLNWQSGSFSLRAAFVWLDDTVIYYNQDHALVQHSLTDQEKEETILAENIPFTPAAVPEYDILNDMVGLRLSDDGKEIIVNSCNQRTELQRVPLQNHTPPEPPQETGISSALSADQIAVTFTFSLTEADAARNPAAWVAFYDENYRMLEIQSITESITNNSTHSVSVPETWATCKAFLTDPSMIPLCAANSINNQAA